MKKPVTCIAAAALLAVCLSSFAERKTVHGYPIETEHLSMVWADDYDEEALERVKHLAEKLYGKTISFVKDEPTDKLVIIFRGRAGIGPDATRDYPTVGSDGVVSLFRFSDDIENYFHAFVHELVHALRIHRAESADWFFEEAFAEFVRLRVYDSLEGFPWFGFSPTVVASGHIVEGTAIPLETLRTNHSQLNIRCRAQAYVLRAAFFEWLGNHHGDDKILKMSQESIAGEVDQYEEYFGRPFQVLADDWKAAMREAYDADPFKEYQTNTPIRHIPLCNLGSDR